MDFNATIDLIIKDLEEAREIIDDLKRYPGVPFLQVELAKSKCRSAAEIIALLKGIKESMSPSNDEPAGPAAEKKVQKEKVLLPDAKIGSDAGNEVVEIKKVEIKKEETEVISTREESIQVTSEVREKPGSFIETKTTIIADRFRHREDETEIFNSKKLSNLSEAIGINDSFLFIREIFNGNKATYTEAITKLDKAESIKDAKAVIMSYTGSNLENEAIDQLLHLVKRKLLLHE